MLATDRLFTTPISTSNLREPEFDRLWQIVSASLTQSGQLQTGTIVSKLEQELCRYHDAKYCVAFSTGFWALVAAVSSKAIPARNEVIIPSMTYRRLADVVFWTGNVPVFVDVQRKHLAISPAAVEAAICDQTSLILAVHPIVNCCDVNSLIAIAQRHAVPIVFDAVESVHETVSGKRVGSFGVGEVFSFHASKLINGLEGGYVCTDDASLQQALIEFREGTSSSENKNGQLSLNGILNDVHAAFALAELAEIDANVAHNREIYQAYCSRLSPACDLEIMKFDESQQTSFKNIVARVLPSFGKSRDELTSLLNERGVLARSHYYPALHTKSYQYPVRVCDTPVSDQCMLEFINLPCGSRVSVEDVHVVCDFLERISAAS